MSTVDIANRSIERMEALLEADRWPSGLRLTATERALIEGNISRGRRILAIEAEAAPPPSDGLREAAQAFVEVNDRGGLGLEYDVAWEDALDRIRAALRDEGETT